MVYKDVSGHMECVCPVWSPPFEPWWRSSLRRSNILNSLKAAPSRFLKNNKVQRAVEEVIRPSILAFPAAALLPPLGLTES